jgi:putative ABC transport system permease protein
VPEAVLADLGFLREVGQMSPVIEGEMALVTSDLPRGDSGVVAPVRRSEAVRVLGVDILRDLTLRDYAMAERQQAGSSPADALSRQEFLDLLTSPRTIVITEKLARRRGVRLGDELPLMTGDRIERFVVRGLLKDEGPAKVMDGSFVLMDIAAAQWAFNRMGRVDRIDVQLTGATDSAAIDAALAQVRRQLPPGLTAQRPARRGEQVERMLAAFHMNLTALSWVSLIVGLFLVYNTVTISVIARRDEIGMLRALGVTRHQVLWLFLGEAAALGVTGVALGIGLGRVLADAAVGLTSQTVSTLYIATAAVPPDLAPWHIGLAFALGVPLSLLAATLPALEASRVSPTSAMRGHDRLESRVRLQPRVFMLALVILAAAFALAQLGPVGGRPIFGYVSSFATIIGASLLVPATIFALTRVLYRPLRRLLGVEGLLAHANLSASIPRVSISVAALAVSLSMMVAIAVMIGSFRDTVAYWIGQTLQADLFIGPGMQPTTGSEQTLSADVQAAVAAHPDVVAYDSFRNIDLIYRDNFVSSITGPCCSRNPRMGARPCRRRSAPSQWWCQRPSRTATVSTRVTPSPSTCRRAHGRSGSPPSPTITPSTAAWW